MCDVCGSKVVEAVSVIGHARSWAWSVGVIAFNSITGTCCGALAEFVLMPLEGNHRSPGACCLFKRSRPTSLVRSDSR